MPFDSIGTPALWAGFAETNNEMYRQYHDSDLDSEYVPQFDASLGVPEVWVLNGDELECLLLGSDGQYTVSSNSRAIPYLPLAEFVPPGVLAASPAK